MRNILTNQTLNVIINRISIFLYLHQYQQQYLIQKQPIISRQQQQQMIDKLKHSLSLNKDQSFSKTLPPLISIFQSQDIKSSKQMVQNLKQTLNFLSEIANTNKQAIKNYISSQIKAKQSSQDPDDQKYTFQQDLAEIQTNMTDVINNFKALQEVESKIQNKIDKLLAGRVDDVKVKELEGRIRASDDEIRVLKEQIKINKENQNIETELLMNSKMQASLLSNQVKQLQEKVMKYQKELGEKSSQLFNLQQEKKHLLSMNSSNPQIQALKNQLSQTEKRYTIEKSKVQQKQKQIQQAKKKIEEEKNNLISMADDLKKSQFKQQQIAKKYQSSKTEIRKYRQIKLEEIKKLNQQIGQLKNKSQKVNAQTNQLKQIIKSKDNQIEKAKQGYQTAVSHTIKQNNLQQEVKTLDQNLKQSIANNQQKQSIIGSLKLELQQLKQKRQSLLKILEQPVRHQIHNLQKIHKHMEILYRDYIGEVFQKGNVVGFQRQIKNIMANIMELKEDLLM